MGRKNEKINPPFSKSGLKNKFVPKFQSEKQSLSQARRDQVTSLGCQTP